MFRKTISSYMQPKPTLMQRIAAREPSVSWSLVLAIFFVIALIILWIAGQSIAITLSGENFTAYTASTAVIGAALGSLAAALVVFLWARRQTGIGWVALLRFQQPIWLPIFVVILIGLGAAWAIDLIGILLKIKGDQVLPPILDALRNPIGITWVIAAVFAIVIQPLAEGFIFYGVLYPALARDVKNNWIACFAVAVFYAAVNAAIFNAGAIGWFLLVQPLLMAFVIALVRAYSQSALSAIIARVMFGLFFVLAALISVRF
jgi:membrane protease YdiL (CAAX protease family)